MVKEMVRALITGLMEQNMLDNLKTQKVMVKEHTPTQDEIPGRVSGDWVKRPRMVLMTNLLKEKFFTTHI